MFITLVQETHYISVLTVNALTVFPSINFGEIIPLLCWYKNNVFTASHAVIAMGYIIHVCGF